MDKPLGQFSPRFPQGRGPCPFPISAAWEHLKRYLDLMESALSREPESADSYAGYDDPDEEVE